MFRKYITKYIYELKGELIEVIPPQNEKQLDLFLKAGNIALAYLDINKYLDQEDIKSLGWSDKGSLWFEKDTWLLRKWKNHELDIYDDSFTGEDPAIVFRGTIKNKSELKKLMKQLGI